VKVIGILLTLILLLEICSCLSENSNFLPTLLFLTQLVISSNHGLVLFSFRDTATNWSKITTFLTPSHFFVWGESLQISR